MSNEDPRKPLLVSHKPPLSKTGAAKDLQTDTHLKSEKLSIENLLVQTAQVCILILCYEPTRGRSTLCTVKPRYDAPAFNIIPPIKYINVGVKKYSDIYLHIGNSENLGLKHNFGQSPEMRYSGV